MRMNNTRKEFKEIISGVAHWAHSVKHEEFCTDIGVVESRTTNQILKCFEKDYVKREEAERALRLIDKQTKLLEIAIKELEEKKEIKLPEKMKKEVVSTPTIGVNLRLKDRSI